MLKIANFKSIFLQEFLLGFTWIWLQIYVFWITSQNPPNPQKNVSNTIWRYYQLQVRQQHSLISLLYWQKIKTTYKKWNSDVCLVSKVFSHRDFLTGSNYSLINEFICTTCIHKLNIKITLFFPLFSIATEHKSSASTPLGSSYSAVL